MTEPTCARCGCTTAIHDGGGAFARPDGTHGMCSKHPVYRGEAPGGAVQCWAFVAPPHPSLTDTRAWLPLTPLVRNAPSQRSAAAYIAVLEQFVVEFNPRYKPRDSNGDGVVNTFCNIFVWDVTRAMFAEVPHWVAADGVMPCEPNKGRELNANATVQWLNLHGPTAGWERVASEKAAQDLANLGHPVVVGWLNPVGIGHVAMVRPGEWHQNGGPRIAQAGKRNFSDTGVLHAFGSRPVTYWGHTARG